MKWATQSSGKKSLNDAPPAPGGEGRAKPETHTLVQVHWLLQAGGFAGTFLLQYFLLEGVYELHSEFGLV